EAAADIGGTLGQAALLTKPGQEAAERAVSPVTRPITTGLTRVANLGIEAVNKLRMPEAQKALTQAIQPGVNIPRAQESIAIAGPRIQQIRTANGVDIPEGAGSVEGGAGPQPAS